jgi:hypothetical protein
MGFENRGEARWSFEGLQFDSGLPYLFLYSKYHLYVIFLSLRISVLSFSLFPIIKVLAAAAIFFGMH